MKAALVIILTGSHTLTAHVSDTVQKAALTRAIQYRKPLLPEWYSTDKYSYLSDTVQKTPLTWVIQYRKLLLPIISIWKVEANKGRVLTKSKIGTFVWLPPLQPWQPWLPWTGLLEAPPCIVAWSRLAACHNWTGSATGPRSCQPAGSSEHWRGQASRKQERMPRLPPSHAPPSYQIQQTPKNKTRKQKWKKVHHNRNK